MGEYTVSMPLEEFQLSDDGWWLLRASNTQDVLVARAESESEEPALALRPLRPLHDQRRPAEALDGR